MEGKILIYDINTGNGNIIGTDKIKYTFNVEDWVDFENMPEIGMRVFFKIDGSGAKEVSTIELKNSLEEEEAIREKEKEEAEKKGEKFIQEQKNKKLDVEFYSAKNVPETLVDESIDNFFGKLKTTLAKHDSYGKNKNEMLDYFKMKRFLNTAYNNLVDIDCSIGMDEGENKQANIGSILSSINEVETIYNMYKKSYLYPKLAFSTIFLKYTRYKDAKRRLELNIMEANKIRNSLTLMEEEIKNLSEKLSKLDKKRDQQKYEDIISDLKKTKKIYVDSIDRLGVLREENDMLIPIANEYFEKFFGDFSVKFETLYKKNIRFLTDTLNSLAYNFDKSMWAKAKTSISIKRFFESANIEDDYNCVTYLGYYLKRLDKTKLSTENRDLYDLYQYLKSNYK